jgi:hypothetical protein
MQPMLKASLKGNMTSALNDGVTSFRFFRCRQHVLTALNVDLSGAAGLEFSWGGA